MNRLPVQFRHLRQRLLQILQRRRRAVERIHAEAEQIPIGFLHFPRREQTAEPPFLQREIPPVVDVDHDLGFGHAGEHGVGDALSSGGVEGRQVGEVGDARGFGFDVDVGASEGPEHAVAELVAETDDGEVDAFFLEGLEGVGDVLAEGGSEGTEGGGPCGGGPLFLGVGPVVGEVEVEVDFLAFGVEAFGEGEDVFEVVGFVVWEMVNQWPMFVYSREGWEFIHPPSYGTVGFTQSLSRTVFMSPSARISSAGLVTLPRAVSLYITPPSSIIFNEERSCPA